jgi:hypothetical protein
MRNATLEKLVWVLIYGGILIGSLGFFASRADATVGWVLGGAGAAAVLAGVAALVWRSRRADD